MKPCISRSRPSTALLEFTLWEGTKSAMSCNFSHQQISNRHCLIFKEYKMLPGMEHPTECVYVEDLSSNGTYVNGKRIGRNTRRLLSPGDEIQLAIYDPRKDKEPFDDKFYIFKMPQRPNQDGDGKSFQNEYLVTKVLGSGTFAQVKMAIHKATGRKFAVKIVDKERFKAKPKVVVSLEQEISILMSINHPCIISIHSVFDEQRYLYLVLELAKDGELFDLIVKNSKLSEADVRHILYQLFQALKYLHDRGVAHRDLKPENVLLANKQKLHIKISDFGLAKIVGEDSFLQSLCGTPSYVAPEVLTPSKQRNYGKAVDLWSCGVMMYICLCGFPPFSEELAPPSMQNQIRQGRFDFPSPYWDDISEEARDLVTKLLTVDPSKRATVDEALDHPWMHMQLDSEADSKLPDPSDFLSDLSRDFHRQNTSTSMASPSSPSPSPTDSTSFTPHVNDLASHVNDPDIVVSHPPIGDSETSLASTSPLNGQKNIQGPDDPSFPRLAPLYSKDATIYPKSETADSMSNLSEYDIAEMKSRPRVL
ncbi:kinase-like domain-containing protein [Endogone sp. FLAS-F59071]|nr:kinase-like domain-containing protein [Endogone sp. FLAS-F59071]|eukprot:RUS23159.1 kinase-like domain-containing protein [Endogone sp. FLAS-F59071]